MRVDGLAPGDRVTIRAWSRDWGGRRLEARARFIADPSGLVDLTHDAPLDGDYAGVDPMGLVWAASPVPAAAGDAPAAGGLPSAPLTIRAEVAGEVVGETVVERRRLPEGVVREVVRDGSVVGTLFHPVDGGRHPGVILLGGSDGGLHELDAALLAGHGFAVLAQAYSSRRRRAPATPRRPAARDVPRRCGPAAGTSRDARDEGRLRRRVTRRGSGAVGGCDLPGPGGRGREHRRQRGHHAGIRAGLVVPGHGRHSLRIVDARRPVAAVPAQRRDRPLRTQVEHGDPVELGLVFEAGLAAVDAATLDAVTSGRADRRWAAPRDRGPGPDVAVHGAVRARGGPGGATRRHVAGASPPLP